MPPNSNGFTQLPLVDAASIQGTPVSTTSPSSGQALVFNATSGQYEPGTVSSVGGAGGYPPDYASLTGSKFSGPVTASVGVSASVGSFGLLPATYGDVRVTNANKGGGIYSRNTNNTLDHKLIDLDNSDNINIGHYTAGSPNVSTYTANGGNMYWASQGTSRLLMTDLAANFGVPVTASAGISGSLTRIAANIPYLLSQGGITLTTTSLGQVIISGSGAGGGGGGAPTTATYLTLTTDSTLTSERTLSVSGTSGLILADAGAGGAATLSINNNIVATISGATFSGPVVGASAGGFTGSITRLVGGAPYITVPGNNNIITLSTGSTGQIILSGTGPNLGPYALLAGATFTGPLTASNGIQIGGSGDVVIGHSGSTIRAYNALHRVHEIEGQRSLTTGSIQTIASFISGTNGRSYAVDVSLMAQHTSTIECAHWKLSGHYRRTAGVMVFMRSDTSLSSSNVLTLSGTLTSSAGDIIVRGSGPASGTFNWACSMRVQELGV